MKSLYATDFCAGSYSYRSRGVSVQRSVNLYPERIEATGGKVQQTLVALQGLRNASSVAGVCHGLYQSSTGPGGISRLWGIFGPSLYCFTQNADGTLAAELCGTVNDSKAVIGIADNGFDLVVADGTADKLKRWGLMAPAGSVGTTYQEINLPQYSHGGSNYSISPTQVVCIAQRFVINGARDDHGFGLLFYSEPASTSFEDTSSGVGVLNFFSAEQSADKVIALAVCEGNLWIFGPRSYEIWSPTDSGFLSFVAGSAGEFGVQSQRSVCVLGDAIYWLGASNAGYNAVWMAQGVPSSPKRISTNALEHEIGALSDRGGAVGMAYSFEGHQFYCLTFPGDRRTVCYDRSTEEWHDRTSRDYSVGQNREWGPRFCANGWGNVYFGMDDEGLFRLDDGLREDSYTDPDDPTRRFPLFLQRVSPIYWDDARSVAIRELVLDCEVGTTPKLAGQGRVPKVLLEVSTDGGNTWRACPIRTVGPQGDYTRVIKWRNLGAGRSFVARFTITEPIPMVIYGIRLTVEERGLSY